MVSQSLKKCIPLGFLMAGSLLGASSAQAADPCGMSYTVAQLETPDFACDIGDKRYSEFNFSFDSGSFSFSNSPLERHTFSGTGLELANSATPHTYSYTVSVFTGPETFHRYRTDLQSSSDPLPTGATNELTNSVNPNISTAVFPTPGDVVGLSGTSVTFTGTIENIPAGAARIDGFTDSLWQTPGPMPILGAGAVFGFSRKLRSRIKASV